MTQNAINWFEIPVADMDRAKKFYSAVFQRNLMDLPTPDDSVMAAFEWVEGGSGSAGALYKSEHANPGGNGVCVYFACEDCAVEEARVEAAGGKVLNPKFGIGDYGFVCIFMDTEGNVVGMHSQK